MITTCTYKDQINNDNLDLVLMLWNIGTPTLPVVRKMKHLDVIKNQ